MCQWNRNVHTLNKRTEHLFLMAHVDHSVLPSFSKFRLFSPSWSAFLWYSVKRCCSMILSFSSKEMLLSAFFLMFACETEWQWGKMLFSWSFLIKLLLSNLENNARSNEKKSGHVTSSSSSFMIFSSLVCEALGRTQFGKLEFLCPKVYPILCFHVFAILSDHTLCIMHSPAVKL